MFKKYLINIISSIKQFKKIHFNDYLLNSYSQEGEDMILRRLLDGKKTGFYVDIGAHHPFRFSNTYFFYKRGWKGINVDAMPGSMQLFKKYRRRDINLEISVGNDSQNLTYYLFNEPALNGFSKQLSNERHFKNSSYHIISTLEIEKKSLSSILNEFLPQNQEIDFLSIDVEGLDFEVLESNNWKKFKPKIILVELLNTTLANVNHHKITKFLNVQGYTAYSKALNTVIFKLER